MSETPAQEQKNMHRPSGRQWLSVTLLNVMIFPGWLFVLNWVLPWLLESLDTILTSGRMLLFVGSLTAALIIGVVYMVRTKNEGLSLWKRCLPLVAPLVLLVLLLLAVSDFSKLHPT